MATYKEIKGVTLQTRDEDPVQNVGTWSSDANMNTARISSTGTGSSSEGYIIAGGYYLPPSVDRSATESYNGTAWSEVQDCPQDLTYGNGLGSYTSSLLCSYSQPGPAPGGFGPTTATHQWNGSSWSTKNSMNTFRQNAGTGGTTTAGIVFGGSAPGVNANTETWDGTNWTEVGDLNTAKSDIGGGVGTSTAALSASGAPATTEQWDGSSWTEVGDINTPRFNSGKIGLYTSALCASGQNPSTYLANVESWDGTSWTEVADVSSARGYIGGATISGGNTTGIVAGGAGPGSPGLLSSTEIWAFPPPTAAILTEGSIFLSAGTSLKGFGKAAGIPAATWASGGSLNTARKAGSGGGRQTNAIAFAGFTTTMAAVAETYDGTSFTEVADLNTARRYIAGSGATGTAAIGFGGQTTTTNVVGNTETWNGSAWSEAADLNTSRGYLAGANFAPSSASLGFGGDTEGDGTGDSALTESWNGSTWTEVGDLNTGRRYLFGSGIQTSAILAGGLDATTNVDLAETWDGSSWSEVSEINTARRQQGSAAASNSSALIYGGYAPPGRVANTEVWNGSSWSEVNDLSTARYDTMNAGSGISAFGAGGETTTVVTNTEEFTADDALSTVTVS